MGYQIVEMNFPDQTPSTRFGVYTWDASGVGVLDSLHLTRPEAEAAVARLGQPGEEADVPLIVNQVYGVQS